MSKYSKMTTQFETQSTAFSRLRAALPFPEYIVRGYDGYLKVFKGTEDQYNPELILTIYVQASLTADEVGFFPKNEKEVLLVGRDIAFHAPTHVKPLLGIGV